MRWIFVVVLFLLQFVFWPVQGQNDSKLYQLSGIIKNEKLEPVPLVHVYNLNLKLGAVSHYNGLYTIVVRPSDSILFSSIGYKHKKIRVPDLPYQISIIKEIFLELDTVELAEVRIFPWKTYEEFKKAVLNTKFPNKEMEIAQKNIALIQTQILVSRSLSPGVNFKNVMQQQFEKNMFIGQYPSISILNPISWAKFIKAMEDGDFKKEKPTKK